MTLNHNERAKPRVVLVGTLIGSAVEWYDFFIFGLMAGLVFGELFFPSFDPVAGTLLSFATFATGWLARPIGGIVAGHFGDRIGRKKLLVVSLVSMGVCTTLIGLLPTYATIGVWAPTLLVILRVLQGLAVGGEYGGAVVTAVEHAPRGRRGLYGSWPNIGVPIGLVMATLITMVSSALPGNALVNWAWRVPFLVSALLIGVGLFVRLRLDDSPVFVAARRDVEADTETERTPLVEVLRSHPRQLVILMLAHIAPNTYFYTYVTFIVAYATTQLEMSKTGVLLAVATAGVVQTAALPCFGLLSDRVGRKPMYLVGLAALAATAGPFFLLIDGGSVTALAAGLCVVIVCHSVVYGTQASFFAEMFPTRVRYTGLSLGYQVAGALFGAPLPIIATVLVTAGEGEPWYLVAYMVGAALISFIAVMAAVETSKGDIEQLDAPFDEVSSRPVVG